MKPEAKKAYRDCAAYTLNGIDRGIKALSKDIAENELMAGALKQRVTELKRFRAAIEEDLENL